MSRPYHAKPFWKIDTTFFQEIFLSSGVFRRETASGFYPWCNVVSPRKRVAEGLCGWRHGNSFPMTQSAQSHRQMRSIPLCSKAVFYVFCFRAPSIYPLTPCFHCRSLFLTQIPFKCALSLALSHTDPTHRFFF